MANNLAFEVPLVIGVSFDTSLVGSTGCALAYVISKIVLGTYRSTLRCTTLPGSEDMICEVGHKP